MDNFSVRIPGTKFILESNQTYRIEARTDETAPIATNSKGERFKLPYLIPNGDNSMNANVPYDEVRKVWDTGLYDSSPSFKGENKKYIEETLELFEEKLIPELSLSFPEGALKPPGINDVFDNYRYEIKPKRSYNTSRALDFFGLWVSFLSNTILSEEDSKDKSTTSRQKAVPFIIYGKDTIVKDESSKQYEKSKAKAAFINLIESDKDHDKELLFDVLNYLGVNINNKTTPEIANTVFINWIDNKNSLSKNAQDFNKFMKHFKTEEGEEEMLIYKGLVKGKKENTITYKRGEYFIKSENIGSNLKQAAKTINKDDNLKELVLEII